MSHCGAEPRSAGGGPRTEITRDTPGQALVLEEPGTGVPASTGCSLLFLLPFWTLPILIHFYASAETHTASNTPFCALFPGAVAWYAFVGILTFGAIAGTRVLRCFAADRATGSWVIEESGIAGLLPRRTSFALAEIDRIAISLWSPSLGTRARRLALTVRFARRGGIEGRLPGLVFVEGLDRKEEAIDFAIRLGAVVGLCGYRVVDDGRQLRVEVTRAMGEGMQPVPVAPPAADYDRTARTQESDPLLEPPGTFDPAAWVGEERIVRWEPGTAVELHRPFHGRELRGCLFVCATACLVGLAGTVLVWFFARGGLPMLAAVSSPWVVLYALSAALAYSNAKATSKAIDWSAKAIRFGGGTRYEVPFADLERIDVRLTRVVSAQRRGEPFRPSFQGRLLLVVRHPMRWHCASEVLAQTLVVSEDRLVPYRLALPLGIALAAALDVPWVFVNESGP